MFKKLTDIKIFFSILIFIVCVTSCEKEYSYEGGNEPPVVIIDSSEGGDTVVIDPGELPSCPSCIATNDIEESSWSFRTGNALLCGVVDTAIMLGLERNTFTFFGPSSCAIDTGLIFTISLGPNSMDKDLSNVVAINAAFYYYHTSAPYVLLSHYDQPFNFIITSYIHATKTVTGTFSGAGFREDGRAVSVTDGKFKFKII